MPDKIKDTCVPVLTLWTVMTAEWLQCDPDPAVMLDSAAAGSGAQVTARTPGVKEDERSH